MTSMRSKMRSRLQLLYTYRYSYLWQWSHFHFAMEQDLVQLFIPGLLNCFLQGKKVSSLKVSICSKLLFGQCTQKSLEWMKEVAWHDLLLFRGRTVGCSVSLSVRHIVVALILKIYPWMLHSLGLSHLFGFHAIVLIVGVFFVAIVVPETRGLTLTQLTTLFGGQIKSMEITGVAEISNEEQNDLLV